MSIAYYFSTFLFAAMPMAVAAPSAVGAADADAAVVPYEYTSAFEGYRRMEDEGASPGSLWRTANEEVARIGGPSHSMHSMQDPAASSRESRDDPAEWSPVAPHSGHHGSHH